jgi:hypothetical protein
MKIATLKHALVLASFLAGVTPFIASARTDPTGTLGPTLGATDYLQITCTSGDSLEAQITNLSPAVGPVKMQIQIGQYARYTYAPTGSPAKVYMNGGAGTYTVLIDKNVDAALNYSLQYLCKFDIGNRATETAPSVQILNQ